MPGPSLNRQSRPLSQPRSWMISERGCRSRDSNVLRGDWTAAGGVDEVQKLAVTEWPSSIGRVCTPRTEVGLGRRARVEQRKTFLHHKSAIAGRQRIELVCLHKRAMVGQLKGAMYTRVEPTSTAAGFGHRAMSGQMDEQADTEQFVRHDTKSYRLCTVQSEI